ncbi:universal stress protein [Nonomuraea roseoviolacea]|uniref:Nucleotide-binding universal stress UspA family protein n=1 Tax=Nonomuraea roseoviolacea subsp. carminata TaxID=160689 RepID=A0ABT1KFB3_9ACTN|nr:universal stress protein [Nonomuraea roseoviolacea]MCP2352709.1 nucleotide-binding universal stress UspA family protein [Nonomuraea roseoviolacea subsp. carminata]
MTEPIVVGFDGSQSSQQALAWAEQEAAVRDAPLRVLHAMARWSPDVLLVPEPSGWEIEADKAAREQLTQVAAEIRSRRPRLEVTTDVVGDRPGDALVHASEAAQLVVVGNRGRGGFAELLLGSVSRHVATRAPRPVAVVREKPAGEPIARYGVVVVGVSGLAGEDGVLEYAFREAVLRGSVLRAVHAWTHPGTVEPWTVEPVVFDTEATGRDEAQRLAGFLVRTAERFPDVELSAQVVRGHPGKALAAASAEADVVIVGAAHGATGALLGLGGTAHAILHHARAPVIVVRG